MIDTKVTTYRSPWSTGAQNRRQTSPTGADQLIANTSAAILQHFGVLKNETVPTGDDNDAILFRYSDYKVRNTISNFRIVLHYTTKL